MGVFSNMPAQDVKFVEYDNDFSTDYVTILNVTSGSGYLHWVSIGNESVYKITIGITIDGGTRRELSDEHVMVSNGMALDNDSDAGDIKYTMIPIPARFNSSLKVEAKATSLTSDIVIGVCYSEDL